MTGQPYARSVEVHDEDVRLTVDHGETAIPQIMRTLEGAGIGLRSIELHRPTLDDVFLSLTGHTAEEVAEPEESDEEDGKGAAERTVSREKEAVR